MISLYRILNCNECYVVCLYFLAYKVEILYFSTSSYMFRNGNFKCLDINCLIFVNSA